MNYEDSFQIEITTDKVEILPASKIVDKNLMIQQFDIKLRMTEGTAERLFYKCWGQFGDDVVRKWLEAEGYEMKKVE